MSEQSEETWAVIELMGHVTTAGRIARSDFGLIRVDIPAVDGRPAMTQEYGPGAVYRITYCTEETARRVLRDAYRPPVPLALRLPDGDDIEFDPYDYDADVDPEDEAEPDYEDFSPENEALEAELAEAEAEAEAHAPRRHTDTETYQSAVKWARRLFDMDNFYVLDLETTSAQPDAAEIVQLAVIDKAGEVVFDTLVNPGVPIPAAASDIHGITDDMVADAPTLGAIWDKLDARLAGEVVVIYNAAYDSAVLDHASQRRGLLLPEGVSWQCAMRKYADFYGDWNEYRGSYRWQKLSEACLQQGIEVSGAHAALGDCQMTLALLRKMAEAGGGQVTDAGIYIPS